MVPQLRSTVATLLLVGLFAGLGTSPVSAQSGNAPAIDSTLAQVDSLRSDGRFEEAMSRLTALQRDYGDTVGILWRMSMTQVDRSDTIDDEEEVARRYEKALRLADEALVADTMNAHAHFAKSVAEGRLALEAGTREQVRRSRAVQNHAERAIELDSTLAGAYHVRGRWNREVSDLNFFERTIVKTVYGGLPDASYEQAVRDFERAIELEDVRFHHLELGKTYLKMDRPSAARAELQTVIDLPAREPSAEQYEREARELLDDLD